MDRERLEELLAKELDYHLPELIDELIGWWGLGFIIITGRNEFGYEVTVRDDLSEEQVEKMNIPKTYYGFEVVIKKGKEITANSAQYAVETKETSSL